MSPFLFQDCVYQWLDKALDLGISEHEYWDMTIAELIRAANSKRRVHQQELREKATMDYLLADLIGRSVARSFSANNKMPRISQVYPSLFDDEEAQEKIQEKKNELSVLRFKQFAQAYNGRWLKRNEQ